MIYQECVKEIESYSGRGIRKGLERVIQALHLLGNPHLKYLTLHVAGTNGKGSTCVMASSILAANGLKTGLTISPHVLSLRERIQINGQMITQDQFVECHQEMKQKLDSLALTYFEWMIVMAFFHFEKMKVDVAVLETGMGGRWDATNVCVPVAVAITQVGLDHQEVLGDDVQKILEEKMQIIKPSVPAWTAIEDPDLERVLLAHCESVGSTLTNINRSFTFEGYRGLYSDGVLIESPLAGEHQIKNLSLALGLCQSLRDHGFVIDFKKTGFETLKWPARLEWIDARVLLDGAHNADGIRALAAYLQKSDEKWVLVCSVLKDRPLEAMLKNLMPYVQRVILGSFDHERARSVAELESFAQTGALQSIPYEVVNTVDWKSYFDTIPASEKILVTGSLYFVSAVRQSLTGENS